MDKLIGLAKLDFLTGNRSRLGIGLLVVMLVCSLPGPEWFGVIQVDISQHPLLTQAATVLGLGGLLGKATAANADLAALKAELDALKPKP